MLRAIYNKYKNDNFPIISIYSDCSFLYFQNFIRKVRLSIFFLCLIILLFPFFSSPIFFPISLVATFFIVVKQASILKSFKNWFESSFAYDQLLLELILNLNLFDEASHQSVKLSYLDKDDKLLIIAFRQGNKFDRKISELEVELAALINLPLKEKIENYDAVDYYFEKEKPLRKQVSTSLPAQDDGLLIDIYGDFVINLRHNYSMLVSGASGAGKSYFTYYWLTRFISQTVEGKHAKLFAIDPKQSDLYKLCRQAGMPTENFGTTNAEAFKIVRLYLDEMENRMAIYDKSPAFDSVGIDIGLEPTLLVLEEYSSLVASMDSKQKKEFENMVAIIAQKARSLSMGLLILMQQPRADSLSSNIREQMVNSIFLGNPSKESAGMMFGTNDLPVVKGKGVGIYSIERDAPKVFESPQFNGNVFDIILPVWKHVAESYRQTSI